MGHPMMPLIETINWDVFLMIWMAVLVGFSALPLLLFLTQCL